MIYNKFDCDVSHQQLRKDFIGSSDAPVIMKTSPWTTPRQLWQQKLGFLPQKNMNDAMYRGKILENEAREKISEILNTKFSPARLFSEKYHFMMANLDGLSECKKMSLEIKCPNAKDHEQAANGKIPNKYYAQLQHQLIVSEHDTMYYLSYSEESMHLILCEADEEYQKNLIAEEKKFYKMLTEFIEPELCENDFEKRTDEEFLQALMKYKQHYCLYNEVKKEFEEAKEELLKLVSSNCVADGTKIKKIIRKGVINFSKMPDELKKLAEEYRSEPSEYWKISLENETENSLDVAW